MKQLRRIKPCKIYITNLADYIGCSNDLGSDMNVSELNSNIELEVSFDELCIKTNLPRVEIDFCLLVEDEILDAPNKQWVSNNMHLNESKTEWFKNVFITLKEVEVEYNVPMQFFNPDIPETPEFDWVMDFDLTENKCTISKR